jgi:Cdc6-like AAA superfamily ATPase
VYYLPSLTALKQEGMVSFVVLYVPILLSLLLFGPLWWVGSIYVYLILKRDGLLTRHWLLIFAAFGFIWFFATLPTLSLHYRTFFSATDGIAYNSLAFVWLLPIPAISAGGYSMRLLDWLARFLTPKTAQEAMDEEIARAARVSKAQSSYAIQQAHHEPGGNVLFLGPIVYSERFDTETGIVNVSNWLGLKEQVLDEHVFILGGTGAGKTGTIKQLIWEILHKTDRDLFLIDGKGEEALAQYTRALAHARGRGNAPIFRLGKLEPGAKYDGFRGSADAVWNRLCAMIGVPEAKGDSEYYAAINRDILQLVCYSLKAGPPRDFTDLRERITGKWLVDTYLYDPDEGPLIEKYVTQDKSGAIKEDPRIMDLATRFRPLERAFRHIISHDGFALEDVRCFIFSIRTQTALDSGKQFLKFFIDDLRDFVGNRQQRPAVIIIDEFAQFGNENIVNLLSLARSSQLGIVLATQDVSMLGEPRLQQMIMANCMTDIVMRTKYPETISMLAGTRKQMEVASQVADGEPTGVQTFRPQDTFRVPPGEVAELPNGGAFLVRRRRGVKIQVRKVEDTEVPATLPEVYTK